MTEPLHWVVTSQVALDAALADPDAQEIEIRSKRGIELTIGDTGTSHVTVAGETTISHCSGHVKQVTDSGHIAVVTDTGSIGQVTDAGSIGLVTGSGHIGRVTGSGRVGAVTDSGHVGLVIDTGHIELVTDSARVQRVTGASSIERVAGTGRVARVIDSAHIGLVTGSSHIGRVTGTGHIELVTGAGSVGLVTDTGSVEGVTGTGRIEHVTGSGHVERVTGTGSIGQVSGAGSVEKVTDSGRIDRAAGTAIVHLYGNATLGKASSHVAVFLHSTHVTVTGGHLIDLTEVDLHDALTWCEHYGVILNGGYAVLYKAVRDDWRSLHGTLYQPGTAATCDDFTPNGHCGGGLHISLTPAQATIYDPLATRYIEVHAPLEEINVIDENKVKVASVVCVREVDITGRPVTLGDVS